jgi:hypothetical protein
LRCRGSAVACPIISAHSTHSSFSVRSTSITLRRRNALLALRALDQIHRHLDHRARQPKGLDQHLAEMNPRDSMRSLWDAA